MSNENAQAPAPHNEEDTQTGDVRDAIQRAKEVATPPEETVPSQTADPAPTTNDAAQTVHRSEHESLHTEPYVIQEAQEMPSAADEEPRAETAAPAIAPDVPTTPEVAPAVAPQNEPVAPATPTTEHTKISIDADHPMAALYIQQPMPPTMQGNRLGGILIGLLATVAFALVYAGLLALWQAPQFPPSTFIQEGMLPLLTSLGYVLPIGAFFVSLAILVLIVNRAGWWAYVLGGFLVAAVVLASASIGYALSPQVTGVDFGLSLNSTLNFMTTVPALAAAVTAREVTVWFGAWIGARGRKVKAKNALAVQEYEVKLAEVQAKLS